MPKREFFSAGSCAVDLQSPFPPFSLENNENLKTFIVSLHTRVLRALVLNNHPDQVLC